MRKILAATIVFALIIIFATADKAVAPVNPPICVIGHVPVLSGIPYYGVVQTTQTDFVVSIKYTQNNYLGEVIKKEFSFAKTQTHKEAYDSCMFHNGKSDEFKGYDVSRTLRWEKENESR